MFSLPSSSGMMRISKNGIEPSSLDSSRVNLMLLSMEFMWYRKASLWDFLMMVKVSSTNLFHSDGGCGDVARALVSRSYIKRFATIGLIGEPPAVPSTCS